LCLPKDREFGVALGVARLGMAAKTGRSPETVMTPAEYDETIFPDDELLSAYDEANAGFRSAYPGHQSGAIRAGASQLA
jgi:xylulokinase